MTRAATIGVILLLCSAILAASVLIGRQQERLRLQDQRIIALNMEHDFFQAAHVGLPIERPMLRSGQQIIADSASDGLYILVHSRCGACTMLLDRLRGSGLRPRILSHESVSAESLVARIPSAAPHLSNTMTAAGGGVIERMPKAGTPTIAIVTRGRIVSYHTGILAPELIRDMMKKARLSL